MRSHKGSPTRTVKIRLIVLQWAILHKHREGGLKGLKGLSSDALASVLVGNQTVDLEIYTQDTVRCQHQPVSLHMSGIVLQEVSAGYPNIQSACLSLDAPTVLSQDNAGASSPVLIRSKQQVF